MSARRWMIYQPACQTAPIVVDMGGDPPILTGHCVEVLPVSEHEAAFRKMEVEVHELQHKGRIGPDAASWIIDALDRAKPPPSPAAVPDPPPVVVGRVRKVES